MDIILIFLPFLLLAGYGLNRFGERFSGLRITSQAEDTIEELWSYSEVEFFRRRYVIWEARNMKKVKREMKPWFIDIALELVLDDLKTKGANSEIYARMDNYAKVTANSSKPTHVTSDN